MNKNQINFAIRAFVSVALIIILLYIMRDKYADIINALKQMRVGIFVWAFFSFFAAISLASIRLKLIVGAGQETDIKTREALSLTLIGYFFNNFLPTAIGGDVIKAYYLSKKSGDKMASYTSVFIDRAMGLVTMVLMATAALLFVQGEIVDLKIRRLIYAITAVAVISILFLMNKNFARKFSFVLMFARPIEEKLKNAYNAIHSYKNHTVLIVKSLAISVVSQILFFASIGIAAISIGSNISALQIFLRMPIISAMSLLPSINGLGIREGATVLLFGPLIGKDKAFAVSVIWLFILFVISVIGGLVYALSPQFRVKLNKVMKDYDK